jgi:hypothetical protein
LPNNTFYSFINNNIFHITLLKIFLHMIQNLVIHAIVRREKT